MGLFGIMVIVEGFIILEMNILEVFIFVGKRSGRVKVVIIDVFDLKLLCLG